MADFESARGRAQQLDEKILSGANSAVPGQQYSDIISLATRQVFGATQLTIARGSDGKWNTSDVIMFMRDNGDATNNR